MLEVMNSTPQRPNTASILIVASLRVLFTALLFTAGGMGLGLFVGIIATAIYGMMFGGHIDMRNAYRHAAIPAAIVIGSAGLIAATVSEFRARRTRW
jgi:H+/Cl- antiporter ClcA